jgi:hypothetical protein
MIPTQSLRFAGFTEFWNNDYGMRALLVENSVPRNSNGLFLGGSVLPLGQSIHGLPQVRTSLGYLRLASEALVPRSVHFAHVKHMHFHYFACLRRPGVEGLAQLFPFSL